jgi:hypothetical protein
MNAPNVYEIALVVVGLIGGAALHELFSWKARRKEREWVQMQNKVSREIVVEAKDLYELTMMRLEEYSRGVTPTPEELAFLRQCRVNYVAMNTQQKEGNINV